MGCTPRRISRGLDSNRGRFPDVAGRHLSEQIRGDFNGPIAERTLFEHLSQQRKLQRRKHSGPVESQLGRFLHVAADVLREHNDFTGFEVQPNARLLWTLTPNQSVWTAVSRAVRTPALTEEGLRLNQAVVPPGTPTNPTPFPAVITVFGSHQFQSEDLLAYELGYRVQATSSFSADIATFYNSYSNLRTAEPGAPFLEGSPVPTDIVIPFVAANKMSGGTYGVELFADWKVVPKWRLVGSYSYLQMNIRKNANSLDPTPDSPNGSSPRHQWYVRSSIDLPKHFEHDTTLRFVDHLASLNIPSYYSLDAHLGWRPIPQVEFSIGGQNLLDNQHLEFIPDFINTAPTDVKRTVYGSMTFKF